MYPVKIWVLFASLVPLSLAATIDYSQGSSASPQTDSYGGDDGYQTQEDSYGEPAQPQGYAKAQVKCTPYYDTIFTDHCESYTDRTCRTTHQERCNDVPDKNCRAVISGRQVRKCFNVTELICKLREDVKYEVVQVGFTVQKCHKVSERVCDTVFDTSFTTKDDYQCLNVQNPKCTHEERTIYDKTCTTATSFECPQTAGYGPSMPMMDSGSSYGHSSGGSDSGYGGGDSYEKQPTYEAPKCRKSQATKCYNTPRTVTVQKCSHMQEKVCEKWTEKVPYAEEKQNCHNEDKKVCELEERSQPKQVKKYVYTKQCRSVPRRVCENADAKQLVPSCVQSTRKQCSQTPVESCEDIPKEHCYKVGRQIKKEKCETVQATYPQEQQGYPQEQQSGGYSSGPAPSNPSPSEPY